jgi:hypothetical protein
VTQYALFRELSVPTVGNAEDIGVTLGTEVVCQPGWLMGYEFVRPSTDTTGPFTAAFYDVASGLAVAGTTITGINPAGVGRIQVLLGTPVYFASEIRARAAIHHPAGRYAFLNNAFAADGLYPSGATAGPLFAPPSIATANGNGLYVAGSSIAMPVNMFDETLYYVSPLWSDVDPVGRTGTGATSATTTLASSGTKNASGTGTLTATAALASTGRKTGQGTGSLTAVGALAEAGAKDGRGTAALAATALLGATGTTTRSGTGSLNATAALGGSGQAQRRGTGALTAAAVLTGSGYNPADLQPDRDIRPGPPHSAWSLGPPHL